MAGQSQPTGMTRGKFVVNPDCTATITASLLSQGVPAGEGKLWGVVVDGGNQFVGIGAQGPHRNAVYLATWTRISPMPANNW